MNKKTLRLYFVNHGGKEFQPEQIIHLERYVAPDSGEFAQEWQQQEKKWNLMFPDGLSVWGHRLLRDQLYNQTVQDRELDCEYIRNNHFPDRPSRFQSFFACESVKSAEELMAKYQHVAGNIWEVEYDREPFRGDMNLLGLKEYKKYWRGEPGDDVFWEFLLVPPVKMIGRVETLP